MSTKFKSTINLFIQIHCHIIQQIHLKIFNHLHVLDFGTKLRLNMQKKGNTSRQSYAFKINEYLFHSQMIYNF